MTDAPGTGGGTRTFLFSDIEGSTRLLDELGRDAYTSVLERHRALLRAAFARHGGRGTRDAGARGGHLPPRPGQPRAEGPAGATAAEPGRGRRATDGLPAAALARRATEQPADAAHLVRRAGARARRGGRPPRDEPPRHLHRTGRHGQD